MEGTPTKRFPFPSSRDQIGSELKEALNRPGAVAFQNCTHRSWIYSDAELDILHSFFPTTWGVEQCPPLLTFRVRELPPRPWPCAIAGSPVYISTSDFTTDNGFRHGRIGGGPSVLESYENEVEQYSENIISQMYDFFRLDVDVSLVQMSWWEIFFKITLPHAVDRKKLPCKIAKQPVYYVIEEVVVPKSRERAPALDESNSTVKDLSIESTSCGTLRNEMSTTSSTSVANYTGKKHLTMATIELSKASDVHHSSTIGKHIETIVRHLPGTDIPLMALKPLHPYSRQPPRQNENETSTITSTRNIRSVPLYTGVRVIADSTGYREGILTAKGTEFSTDPSQTGHCRIQWYWFGNGGLTAIDDEAYAGAAVISNVTNEVIGVLRSSDGKDGWLSGVDAKMLAEGSFEVAEML